MSYFDDPSVGGSGLYVRHLNGQVVVCRVTGYDPNSMYKDKVSPTVTFDAMIVGQGQLRFGGDIPKGLPDNMIVTLPYLAEGISASQVNIVRALAPKAGTGRLVIGKIQRGVTQIVNNSPPWNLVPLEASDAAVRAQAEALWTAHMAGTFINPEPVDTTAPATGPVATPPSALYAAYTASPWDAPPPLPPQSEADPWPQTREEYVAGQRAATPTPPPTPPQAAPAMPPCPTGMDPNMWAGLDDSTRTAILATRQPTPVPPAPPGVNPEKWAAYSDNERRQIAAMMGGSY